MMQGTGPQAAAAPEPSLLEIVRRIRRAPVSFGFMLRRTLGALLAIWGAVTVVFIMVMSTGNPAEVMAAETATQAQIDELSRQYGFDKPVIVQYGLFVKNVATGQFPKSLYTDRPAFQEVAARIPATLQLSLTAVVIGSIIGLLAGYWAATSRYRALSNLPVRFLMLFQSVPSFFLGLVLILIFSLTFRWLPTSGFGSWKNMILPVATLAAYVAPSVARLFRATIRETEFEEHIVTAKAKGISDRRVRIRHVAINALGPVIALIGLQAGGVLAGAVVTETVFAWPGIGELLVRSVSNRDYPVALATVMTICAGFVMASLLVDILVAAINPRAQERR